MHLNRLSLLQFRYFKFERKVFLADKNARIFLAENEKEIKKLLVKYRKWKSGDDKKNLTSMNVPESCSAIWRCG